MFVLLAFWHAVLSTLAVASSSSNQPQSATSLPTDKLFINHTAKMGYLELDLSIVSIIQIRAPTTSTSSFRTSTTSSSTSKSTNTSTSDSLILIFPSLPTSTTSSSESIILTLPLPPPATASSSQSIIKTLSLPLSTSPSSQGTTTTLTLAKTLTLITTSTTFPSQSTTKTLPPPPIPTSPSSEASIEPGLPPPTSTSFSTTAKISSDALGASSSTLVNVASTSFSNFASLPTLSSTVPPMNGTMNMMPTSSAIGIGAGVGAASLLICGLLAAWFLIRRRRKQYEEEREKRKSGIRMVTDTDPTRYEKAEVAAPQPVSTHDAAEFEASGVYEMDTDSGVWGGQGRTSPRLYRPVGLYGR